MFIIRAQIKEAIGKLSRRRCRQPPLIKPLFMETLRPRLQVLATPGYTWTHTN